LHVSHNNKVQAKEAQRIQEEALAAKGQLERQEAETELEVATPSPIEPLSDL